MTSGPASCPWQQPAGIILHDGLKLLDVERRLNQFQDRRFHWEVWAWEPKTIRSTARGQRAIP